MATTVRKSRSTRTKAEALDPVETFRQQVTLKLTAAAITTRAEALKKRLKEALPTLKDAYKNENGSFFYDLPETLEVEGKSFKGMELRRSVKTVFNEEKAEEILNRKAKKDPAIVTDAQSSYIDQDKVFRLVQEDRLTQEDVDKMFEESEQFAFYALEGEVL